MTLVASKVDGFLELLKEDQSPLIKGECLDAHFGKQHAMAILTFELNSEEGKAAAAKLAMGDEEQSDADKYMLEKKLQEQQQKQQAANKAGKARFSLTFEVNKDVDAASPLLFMYYCEHAFRKGKAKPIPLARLTLRKSAGAVPLPYLVLEFTQVHVSSYSMESSPTELPGEKLTFSFKTCKLEYTAQAAGGGARRGKAHTAHVTFDDTKS